MSPAVEQYAIRLEHELNRFVQIVPDFIQSRSCVLAPGSSSTKPINPSGTFWKMAVSFMANLEDTHDSIP